MFQLSNIEIVRGGRQILKSLFQVAITGVTTASLALLC